MLPSDSLLWLHCLRVYGDAESHNDSMEGHESAMILVNFILMLK